MDSSGFTILENSKITNFPPGLRTLLISFSARNLFVIFLSPNATDTLSKVESLKGSNSASQVTAKEFTPLSSNKGRTVLTCLVFIFPVFQPRPLET